MSSYELRDPAARLGRCLSGTAWNMTATPVSLKRKEDKKTNHLFCLAIKIVRRPYALHFPPPHIDMQPSVCSPRQDMSCVCPEMFARMATFSR